MNLMNLPPLNLALLTTSILCHSSSPVHADERPNVILIVADDIGCDWVSCYGAEHRTPNVDRLAREGVRYETAWCTPSSMPSQVTLLTGQYPFRHGWTGDHNVAQQGAKELSSDKFTTLARALSASGYVAVVGGQWQVNRLPEQSNALKKHGFDEHCVYTNFKSQKLKNQAQNSSSQIMTNGRLSSFPNGPQTINSFLIDFITRPRAQPFLVYYPMILTGPATASPRSDSNASGTLADDALRFAEAVTHMDQLVGELIDAVDKAGLRQNTLILFTSDNGSAVAGSFDGKPFEAGKGSKSDSGAHVPFIVRAPFLTEGGRVSRDLIDATDLYPTSLELAQVDPLRDRELDGRSFLPSLRGSEDPFEKRNWIYSQLGEFRMIRDWQHILDSDGNFHDLTKDPLQQSEVSLLDKIAPGRRQRLEMILKRLPKDAPVPFGAR